MHIMLFVSLVHVYNIHKGLGDAISRLVAWCRSILHHTTLIVFLNEMVLQACLTATGVKRQSALNKILNLNTQEHERFPPLALQTVAGESTIPALLPLTGCAEGVPKSETESRK